VGKDAQGRDVVTILAGHFNSFSYTGFDWKLYRISLEDLLNLDNVTIRYAVTHKGLTEIEGDTGTGGFFWGLVAGGGYLIFIKGAEIVIMDETDPNLNSANNTIFRRGNDVNDKELGAWK
jgi:hypothetical protein